MSPQETLPLWIQLFIQDENIKIYYINLNNILGILINKNIWVNTNLHLYKKRFVIVHELAHYIFWWNSDLVWVPLWRNCHEKLADDFALDILLPREKLIKACEEYNWDSTILESIFGVDRKLIEKRVKKLFFNNDCCENCNLL